MKSKFVSQILYYSYCFLMVSFFLPLKLNSIALIITGILSLTDISTLIDSHKRKPIIFSFWLLFGILIIGITYTENLNEGWSIIERHFALLFIPLFAPSFNRISLNQQKKVINLFITTLTLVSLYCLGYAAVDYNQTGSVYIPGYSGYSIYNKFMHHRLLQPVGMHAIFFSLYLSFSFIVLLNRLIIKFYLLSQLYKIGYLLLLLYYLLILILLTSALFAFVLPVAIIILFVFHFKNKLLSTKKFKIISISFIIGISLFSYYGVSSKIGDFSTEFKLNDPGINSLKIRLGIWICSWETIEKNWLLGHGTGDAQNELMKTYIEKNFVIGIEDKFNAHNMYLQYWMSNGVLAVALFMFLLLFFAFSFLKDKQVVAFLVVFLFAMFSLTESTMLKQNGIIFFVLFTSIFYFKNKSIKIT